MISSLQTIDWMVLAGYVVLTFGVGIYMKKKASGSTEDYFLAGRKLPWWVAGTSMVATSFATDAPLAATRLVREEGLSGLWFPLSWLFADLVTLYFFTRLWRRAHVTTDAEITELRYGGKPAALLRLVSGFYNAIPLNCVIIGWVTLAMVKIIEVSLGLPKEIIIPTLVGATLFYSFLSGLWGVVVTDFIQFIIATVGAIVLAVISVNHLGGMENLVSQVTAHPDFGIEGLNFFPDFGGGGVALSYFVVIMAVQWWAQKNVAGGGQLSQRLFACKDEKHSFLAVLWFAFLHYVIRPWPWMIVAMASLVIFPQMVDNEAAYPQMMMALLPAGFKGLMVVSLLAAFMSTLDTHLNWGASYLITDIYKRFLVKDASHRHYVMASRSAMILLAVISGIVVFNMTSIVGAWKFLATMTAGVGPVFILRWYWHRINAWSEISALIASGVSSSVLILIPSMSSSDMFPTRLLLVLGITTVTWVVATFVTTPEKPEVLRNFYRRVKPSGPGWTRIAQLEGERNHSSTIIHDLLAFASCSTFLISLFFTIGKWVLGFYQEALIPFLITIVSGAYTLIDLKNRMSDGVPEVPPEDFSDDLIGEQA